MHFGILKFGILFHQTHFEYYDFVKLALPAFVTLTIFCPRTFQLVMVEPIGPPRGTHSFKDGKNPFLL